MGKKTKSKTISSPQEKEKEIDAKQLENKPSSKKKLTTEIDEIFASKKRKKVDQEKKDGGGAKKKEKKRRRRKEDDDDKSGGFWESDSGSRKKTQDGIAVYTEEELGLNNSEAGGTRLCPFDCSCCF